MKSKMTKLGWTFLGSGLLALFASDSLVRFELLGAGEDFSTGLLKGVAVVFMGAAIFLLVRGHYTDGKGVH